MGHHLLFVFGSVKYGLLEHHLVTSIGNSNFYRQWIIDIGLIMHYAKWSKRRGRDPKYWVTSLTCDTWASLAYLTLDILGTHDTWHHWYTGHVGITHVTRGHHWDVTRDHWCHQMRWWWSLGNCDSVQVRESADTGHDSHPPRQCRVDTRASNEDLRRFLNKLLRFHISDTIQIIC